MLDNEPFASYVLQLPSTLYVIFIFNHDLIIGIFNFYIVCMFDLLWLMLFVPCFRNPRSLPSLCYLLEAFTFCLSDVSL